MTTSFLILFIMPDYSYGIFKQYNLLLLLLFLTPIMRRPSSLNNFLCVFLFLFFFVQLFLVSHLVVPFPVVVFITSALFSDLFLSRKLQQFIQELVFTLQVSNYTACSSIFHIRPFLVHCASCFNTKKTGHLIIKYLMIFKIRKQL